MGRSDGKMATLRRLLPRLSELPRHAQVHLASIGELTHHAPGQVIPAGVPGRWLTLVVDGEVARTDPATRHRAGGLLVQTPAAAIVALAETTLLTVPADCGFLLHPLLRPSPDRGHQAVDAAARGRRSAVARARVVTGGDGPGRG